MVGVTDWIEINATLKVAVKSIVCGEFVFVIFKRAILLLHVPVPVCGCESKPPCEL